MNRRVLMTACVFVPMAVGAFTACVSPNDPIPPIGAGYDASLPDGAHPIGSYDAGPDHAAPQIDASVADATVPDSTDSTDSHAPDTSTPDTSVPDSNAPDTSTPDTSVPDSSVPDTSVPDVRVADTSVPDVSVADTSVPDVSVADVVLAPMTCITAIYGDHYVTTSGQVYRVDASNNQTEVVYDADDSSLSGFTAITQQQDHACGLRNDGTVWCWALPGFVNQNGDLGNGKIDPGTGYNTYRATQVMVDPGDAGGAVYLDNVTSISKESDTEYTFPTCAIRSDKTLWCWGNATQGNIFQGTLGTTAPSPYAIAMASGPKPGDGGPAPVITADQVAVGNRHVCILLAGKVSCFGANVGGNLGTGDTTAHAYPVAVDTTTGLPSGVQSIGVGYDFTCALASGTVWCWGATGASQEGNPYVPKDICNSNYCHAKPVQVQAALADGGPSQTALTGVASIRIGYQFGCALDTGGSMRCWGASNAGVTAVDEATPYANTNSALPSTNIVLLSAWGEDIRSAPRYVTSNGTYVVGTSLVTPSCPIVVGTGGT